MTKHLKLTNGLRGCSGGVGGCSGSGPSPEGVQRECRVTFIHAGCAQTWEAEGGTGTSNRLD